MSVYTTIDRDQLLAFLNAFPVADLVRFEGIDAGIENTNYFVDTADGRWVLTLFERQNPADLPYFLKLMDHVAGRGVPSARPLADHDGRFLTELNDRPAALVERLEGVSVEHPNRAQCAALGAMIARLHEAGRSFDGFRPNCRGPVWWAKTAREVAPRLTPADARLLRDELRFQARHRHTRLPVGVIHADLFRDNALFLDDRIAGLIDFYYACNDVLLFDLAVAVNDWCVDQSGRFDQELVHALVHGYADARPLAPAEGEAWPVLLRAAALRFWLSRAYDWHFPRDGEITHSKDPEPFKRLLLAHRERAPMELG